MIETKQLIFSKEMEITQDLLEKIKSFLNIEARIRVHSLIEKGVQTKAYRIVLSRENARDSKAVLATDWDDTLEKYSLRKFAYHQELAKLFLNKIVENQIVEEELIKFFLLINKVARVLPIDDAHPESYSPYLELLTESYFLKLLEEKPLLFLDILNRFGSNQEAIRHLIKKQVLPMLPGQPLANKLEEDVAAGKRKYYFKEKEALALEISFDNKPQNITEEIWQIFIEKMTKSNLDQQDINNMNPSKEVYWIVSSFGNVYFQLKKILSGLVELKLKGKRLPDEIDIITQGRKGAFLRNVFESILQVFDKKIVYIDDSKGQLKSLIPIEDRVKLLRAIRRGSEKALVNSDSKERIFKTVNLDDLSLDEIVNVE